MWADAGAQVGGKPDFAAPVVLSADRGGTKVESLCNQIHRTLAADFLYALVWGTSSKHYPQRCARAAAPRGQSHLWYDSVCALVWGHLLQALPAAVRPRRSSGSPHAA